MNHRLTVAAAGAVVLASFSEFSLISGASWLAAVVGAVAVAALAGTLARTAPGRAAIGATLLALPATAPLLAARPASLKAAAVLVLVCCAASAAWPRALRPVADLATYLAALLLYLNALFARGQSLALVIPTARSLRHLLTLAHDGAGLARYAPPVPGTPGVLLLAAASIGLVAAAVDLIAVRLRQVAIAGLPLLIVYIAPIATAAKMGGLAGFVAFLLAAAGYLAMLSSDGRDRLRGWGKLVTVWHYSGADERLGTADVSALAATGRRIGLAAVCAAVIAPLLLPSLDLHRLLHGGGPGGTRVVTVSLPDPVDQLHALLGKTTPQPVLAYRSAGASPGHYLQIYVLNYDQAQERWDLVRPAASTPVGGGQLRQPPGLAAGTQVVTTTTQVTLAPSVHGYAWPIFFLPVPYFPERIQVSGSWSESDGTLMIYSGNASPAGLHYTVTSGQPDPTRAQLDAADPARTATTRPYLGFDSPVTGRLRSIARQVTRGQPDAFERAAALERWFQSRQFRYASQSSLPNSPGGLLDFLTSVRQGNCQQFAFAMAVLARLAGIPSRIAIGYTSGTRSPDGTWHVTTADAHAWPELYFSGIGWLRFEPTPGGPAGQGTAVQPSYVVPAAQRPGTRGTREDTSATASPAQSPGSTSTSNPRLRAPSAGSAPVAGTSRPGSALPVAAAALALLVLAGVAPGTARVMTRRRRWHAAAGDVGLAHAAWLEVCADLADLGMSPPASDSPRAVARRVCSATEGDDAARLAIGRIAAVVERARYSPAPLRAAGVRADVRTVRRSLARRAGRIRRWRARLAPSSALRPAREAVRDAAGLLTGWMPSPRDDVAD